MTGFSQPRTDIELPNCFKIFEYDKPFLPNWAIELVASEMQMMHSRYMGACRFGLKDMWARYPLDVFGPKFDYQTDIIFDFLRHPRNVPSQRTRVKYG